MKSDNILYSIILTLVIIAVVLISGFGDKTYEVANTVYQVYLDGKSLGLIADENELYDLINEDQKEIKEKFGVDKVYPPNGFVINKYHTYKEHISEAEEIYAQIKDKKPFTIKGYEVTIKDRETEELKKIFVLDDQIFESAVKKVITAFVGSGVFDDYLNKTQPEIMDVGSLVESMYFDNDITIKEANIAADANVYLDVDTLTRYLLFGINTQAETYVVQSGDTIDAIAYNHKLSTEEFLIANDQFTNANNLLAVGEEVTIALIRPVLTFVVDVYEVEDVVVYYDSKTEYDQTKSSSYRHTEPGENGITRQARRVSLVNGEMEQEGVVVNETVIKAPVTEVITRGGRSSSNNPTKGMWAWPTARPYIITSPYGYRNGEFHNAIDISGTGWRSPIFAALGGVVVHAGTGGVLGGSAGGINIVINHENGYYTYYGHLYKTLVQVGDRVERGQKIGEMGNTGTVRPKPTKANPTRGTHVHFSVYQSTEYYWGMKHINPLSLYR